MNSNFDLNDKLLEEKNDLHKSIDNSFNNILKSLEFIFKAMKYNDKIIEETNDLEIASSTSNISNELSSLLKLVNDMKVKFIKTYEIKKNKRERQKEIESKMRSYTQCLQVLHLQNYIIEFGSKLYRNDSTSNSISVLLSCHQD